MMNKKLTVIMIAMLILPINVSAEDSIELSSINILGKIEDNYVQINYTLILNNPSNYDQELYQPLPHFDNLFLSNVSFEIGFVNNL